MNPYCDTHTDFLHPTCIYCNRKAGAAHTNRILNHGERRAFSLQLGEEVTTRDEADAVLAASGFRLEERGEEGQKFRREVNDWRSSSKKPEARGAPPTPVSPPRKRKGVDLKQVFRETCRQRGVDPSKVQIP